jgi:hypothetical protein
MSNVILTPIIPLPPVVSGGSPTFSMSRSPSVSRQNSMNGMNSLRAGSLVRASSNSSIPASPASMPLSPRGTMSPFALKAENRFVICLSHNLSDDDRELLSSYGKVLFYDHDIHNNLDPMMLEFDYLIIDTRNKYDRYFFIEQIKHAEYPFNTILHCYDFEIEDLADESNYDNVIVQFPIKRAMRRDFNILMLSDRLPKPRWYVSMFKCLYKTFKGFS